MVSPLDMPEHRAVTHHALSPHALSPHHHVIKVSRFCTQLPLLRSLTVFYITGDSLTPAVFVATLRAATCHCVCHIWWPWWVCRFT